MNPRTILSAGAALLILGGPLAACGKLGQLEAPGQAKGAAIGKVRDTDRPVDTIDPRDRTTDPAPPRTLPIEGSGEDVTRSGPPGVLPDPYANPR